MIDLHCHLLPGIDDGPRDLGGALTLAQAHVRAGVTTVAATPHVSWEMPNGAAEIARHLGDARVALAAAEIPLEVVSGAEVDLRKAVELDDDELHALALGGGPWLLLEAPLREGIVLEPVARTLLARGHRVLLAHPERSPSVQRDPEQLRRLAHAGVATQVTASAFTGRFGRTVQRFAESLLAEGLVHTIASDAHDTVRRPPGLAEPLVAAGLADLLPQLAQEGPAAILAGEAPPAPPARRPRRRSLGALLGRR